MAWRPFCIGLLFGLFGATLAVTLYSCGAAVPTATPPPTATRVPTLTPTRLPSPTSTLAPTPTLSSFQLTAQALYSQQVGTQAATRAVACQFVADIYRRHGQTFNPSKDPQLIIAEVRVMEGLDTPDARLSYGGSIIDANNNAQIMRCTAR